MLYNNIPLGRAEGIQSTNNTWICRLDLYKKKIIQLSFIALHPCKKSPWWRSKPFKQLAGYWNCQFTLSSAPNPNLSRTGYSWFSTIIPVFQNHIDFIIRHPSFPYRVGYALSRYRHIVSTVLTDLWAHGLPRVHVLVALMRVSREGGFDGEFSHNWQLKP